MDRELRRLRARIADTAKDTKGHRRFSAELRADLVRFARARVAGGETQSSVAAELGVGSRVLWGWLQVESAPLREVVLEDKSTVVTRGDRRVVLRGGVEIVGLELDELIAIARALS